MLYWGLEFLLCDIVIWILYILLVLYDLVKNLSFCLWFNCIGNIMVFIFSDLYLKLLFIIGESLVDIEEENLKMFSGLVCDKYGLVWLFFIVWLDFFWFKLLSV